MEWISVYTNKPEEGQRVISRICGQEGHVSGSIYTNGYFETYNNCSNRYEITRWKHDEWKPLESNGNT